MTTVLRLRPTLKTLLLFFLIPAFSGFSQQLVDVEVNVVEVSHDWDCGNDMDGSGGPFSLAP